MYKRQACIYPDHRLLHISVLSNFSHTIVPTSSWSSFLPSFGWCPVKHPFLSSSFSPPLFTNFLCKNCQYLPVHPQRKRHHLHAVTKPLGRKTLNYKDFSPAFQTSVTLTVAHNPSSNQNGAMIKLHKINLL